MINLKWVDNLSCSLLMNGDGVLVRIDGNNKGYYIDWKCFGGFNYDSDNNTLSGFDSLSDAKLEFDDIGYSDKIVIFSCKNTEE